MRLSEYLSLVLSTQGQTLARLTAFFGEERFIEILENNESPPPGFSKELLTGAYWLPPNETITEASAYAELESCVQEMQIPAFLAFHVWAYPWYRHFIESGLPLTSRLDSGAPEKVEKLLLETLNAQEAWFRSLHLPSVIIPAAEKAAQNPWLRFRADFMRKLGRKPLSLARGPS